MSGEAGRDFWDIDECGRYYEPLDENTVFLIIELDDPATTAAALADAQALYPGRRITECGQECDAAYRRIERDPPPSA